MRKGGGLHRRRLRHRGLVSRWEQDPERPNRVVSARCPGGGRVLYGGVDGRTRPSCSNVGGSRRPAAAQLGRRTAATRHRNGYLTKVVKPRLDALVEFITSAQAAGGSPEEDSPAATPIEAFAARITQESIAKSEREGTVHGYWMAVIYLTLAQSLKLSNRLAEISALRPLISGHNPDVVLYELSALLLGRAQKELEERYADDEIDCDDDWEDEMAEEDREGDELLGERLSGQVTEIAIILSGLFERIAHFENAEKSLPSRMFIYQMSSLDCPTALAKVLVGDSGHSVPQSVRLNNGAEPAPAIVSLIELALLVAERDNFMAAYLAKAAEYALKLEDLNQQRSKTGTG